MSFTDELYEIVIAAVLIGALVWQARRRAAAQRALNMLTVQEHQHHVQQHEFVRDTAYSIRNTLTIARGHIELINASEMGRSVRQDTEVVLEELERIEGIASDLLVNSELQRRSVIAV